MQWKFEYYGWFGKGDCSDDIPHETNVTDEEHTVLERLIDYENDDAPEGVCSVEDYIEENKVLLDNLAKRVQAEIEKNEKENYNSAEEMPEICVRWPWE